MVLSTVASVAGLSTKPRLTMPLAAWPVSRAFSDSLIRGAVPWPSRSSGTKAAPRRRRAVTDRAPAASPSMMTLSECSDKRSPDSAENNSSWPLPATPAMPRISPPLTSTEMFRRCTPCGSSGSIDRSLIKSRGRVAVRPDAAFTSPMSAPTIMRASEAAVSSCGLQVATFLPPRKIVAVSHSRFTSSNLWLM